MTRADVIATRLERIIGVIGTRPAPVSRITLRGLTLQATTTPLAPGGFGAGAYAVHCAWSGQATASFEKLEIANVGGQAVQALDLARCRILDNHIHHTGACGIA